MVTNLVTKKRGFDIASLVKEDSNVDGNDSSYINSNKRSKNDTEFNCDQTGVTSGSSAFHRPKSLESSVINRKSSTLSTLSTPPSTTISSNSMTNSAFKKVDQKCNLMENAYDFSSFYQRLSASAMLPSMVRNASPMMPAMSLSASLSSSLSSSIPTKSFMSSTLLPYLPPSLAALTFPTSNWCAKCNATFRMTSDLVYHMRSHHKNVTAVDPMKKKREEKLKCNICHETFRERHHLTRHMTSHQ